MTDKNLNDLEFLNFTHENEIFPNNLEKHQLNKFKVLLLNDIQAKASKMNQLIVEKEDSSLNLQLIDNDEIIHEPNWVLLVATKVEFEAAVKFFEETCDNLFEVKDGSTKLIGKIASYKYKKGKNETEKKIYLQRSKTQGSNDMSNLINKISTLKPLPDVCFLVGSCGSLPNKKTKLLDVIVPHLVINANRASFTNNKLVPEYQRPFIRHAKIDNIVVGIEQSQYGLPEACQIETDKEIITVPGKIDDLKNKFVAGMITPVEENIVAVEMEGAGLADGNLLQQERDSNMIIGMVKANADYCTTTEVTSEQLNQLKKNYPELEDDATVSPTLDRNMKIKLQTEATRRSILVALKIMEKI